MDKTLKPALLLLLVLGSASAGAQVMSDPMAPPPQLTAGASDAQALAVPGGLQSIVGTGNRRRAMIDGNLLKVGDLSGTSKIIRITDAEVKLRAADGRIEVMRLYPDVDIKRVVASKRGSTRGH